MNFLDEKVEIAKIAISGSLAHLVSGLEENAATRMFILLLLLMFFDTLLGWAKAKKSGEWQSYKARWGILGKIFELIFIAVAFGLDWVFHTGIVKQAFIAYFCLVEIGSLLENAYQLGVAIPREVVDMAVKTKHFLGWFFVKKVQAILAAVFKMDFNEMESIAKQQEKESKNNKDIKN